MQTHDPSAWAPCPTHLNHPTGPSLPAWRRLRPAPAELLTHLRSLLQATDPAADPRAAGAPADFVADVDRAVSALPRSLLNLLDRPLLGLYTATGLGSSAVCEVVQHGEQTLGAVVVLDVALLQTRSANDWASWKENLPFQLPTDTAVRVTLAHAGDDHRQRALQFLLLHEFGHVLTVGRQFLPDWWIDPQTLKPATHYPFLALAWTLDPLNNIVPDANNSFPGREQLCFYGGEALGGDGVVDTVIDHYNALRRTSFPTLYAVRNAYEDFAECLALYVHTVLLGQPYEVELCGPASRLLADSRSVAARCQAKFNFIAALLQVAPPGPAA